MLIPSLFCDPFLQLLSSFEQSGLHRVDVQLHHVRDILLGNIIQIFQDNGNPVLVIQPLYHLIYLAMPVKIVGVGFRGKIPLLRYLGRHHSRMFLQIPIAFVIENPVEPRVKGFASIIGTEVTVYPDERFLDHVGALAGLPVTAVAVRIARSAYNR